MRAVLVGCGSMSRAWLDAARTISNLEIVGLVDVVAAAAYHRAAEYNPVFYTHLIWHRLLSSVSGRRAR